MTERYGYLEGGELKAPEENRALKGLSKLIQGLSKGADLFGEYSPTFVLGKKVLDKISPPTPVKPEDRKEFDGGLGETLGLAGTAREMQRWSRGDSPVRMPTQTTGVLRPSVDLDRGGDIVDAATTLFPPARQYARLARSAAQAAVEQAGTAGRAYAVKPPGGYWNPRVTQELETVTGARGPLGPDAPEQPSLQQTWLQKQLANYVNRHLGTVNNPAKNVEVAPGTTLDNLTDRILRESPIPEGNIPDYPGAGPGATRWDWSRAGGPRAQHDEFMAGFGDWALTQDPRMLNRMGIGDAIKRYTREQDLATRQARNERLRQQRVGREGDIVPIEQGEPPWDTPEMMAAARQLTEQHPGGVWMETPKGSWYKFDRNMDPEDIKRSLSLDSCVGDNCVATAGLGEDLRYPRGFSPLVDPISGRYTPPRRGGEQITTTSYLEGIHGPTANEFYSFRTPTHRPVVTMHTGLEPGAGPQVAKRDEIIRLITPGRHRPWQQEQQQFRAAERPLQLDRNYNPIGRRRAGVGPLPAEEPPPQAGGMRSPKRPPFTVDQLRSMVEKFPELQPILEPYIMAPPAPRLLKQLQGQADRGPGLSLSPEISRALNRLREEGMVRQGGTRPDYWPNRGGVVFREQGIEGGGRYHPWQNYDPAAQGITQAQARAMARLQQIAGEYPLGYARGAAENPTEEIVQLAQRLRQLRGDVLDE